jgi:hypothetical protein
MFSRKNSVGATALLLLVFSSTSACGDDGSAEDGGVAGASGAGGAGGGDGVEPGCSDPLTEDVLFSPRGLSSVIYKVVEDDGTLYFSTIDKIFRVAVTGGEPEELYYRANAIVVHFWLHGDELLILEGSDLVTMPKSGGDTTEVATLPYRVPAAIDGTIELIVEGDFAYAYSETSATYFEVDLTTYETRVIATEAVNGTFIKLGDALYIAADDPSVEVEPGDFGAFVPDLLYRLPIAGGEAEQLEVEGEPMKLAMLGGNGDTLYLLGASESGYPDSGVYEISTSGGELQQVQESVVAFALPFTIHNTETKTLLRNLDTFYEMTGDGTLEELFCVGGGSYTSHGSTATDEAVYMSQYHSNDNEAFIVRIPLD